MGAIAPQKNGIEIFHQRSKIIFIGYAGFCGGPYRCFNTISNHYCSTKKAPNVTYIKHLFLLVSRQGFEPWTYWLKVNCSTSWATDSYEAHNHEFREASRRGQSKKIKTFQFRRLNCTRNFYWRRNYGWNSDEKLEKYEHFHAYGYVYSLIE